ncbi:MAG: hypothetical protein QM736_20590 [Vicinamibacterales bacterium]
MKALTLCRGNPSDVHEDIILPHPQAEKNVAYVRPMRPRVSEFTLARGALANRRNEATQPA